MINENEMLYCLIAFILGWLVSRHMGVGNGLVVTNNASDSKCDDINDAILNPDGKVGYYCNGWAPGDYIKCNTPPKGGSAPRCCYHIFADDTCIYNN
jgi:hypothetical protein